MEKLSGSLLLKEIYQDIAVCLGGMFAVHKGLIADELIWEISRSLEKLYRKHHSRFDKAAPQNTRDRLSPHPALVNLLKRLKEVA